MFNFSGEWKCICIGAQSLDISLLCLVVQGICRKPQQCKERHKALTERGGTEGLENAEDLSSSQPQAPKVNVMHTLLYWAMNWLIAYMRDSRGWMIKL